MEEKQPATHFSDGTKIICGRKEGKIAEGDEAITCGSCLAMLRKRQTASATEESQIVDPKAVHFSDGTKPICGAKTGTAVFDEQAVKCKKCLDLLARKAVNIGDPLVKCKVFNKDLNEGVDFAFYFRPPEAGKGKGKGKIYRLINNAIHMLPRSVIEHLKLCAYPYKAYKADQEEGHSMVVMGKRFRFIVTEL